MHFKIPLNTLNIFACAARAESFQLAAEQLCISPSAVSHQIRNLEQRLGYKLFKRLDKQVELTERGLELLHSINEPLQQLFIASERALHPPTPSVEISCAPIFATRWLMPRLAEFYARYPVVDLSIKATTDRIDPSTHETDGVIRHGTGNWPELKSHLLINEQPVVVCCPNYLKKLGGQVTAKRLLELPLLDITAHPDRWKDWFAQQNIVADRRKCVVQVQNSAQAIEACQRSKLLCLVDKVMIERELQEGTLAIACAFKAESKYSYYLLWSENKPSKTAFRTFTHWLIEQATAK